MTSTIAPCTVQVSVHELWWLRLYMYGLVMCAKATGLEPDWDKIKPWVLRGLVVKIDRQ